MKISVKELWEEYSKTLPKGAGDIQRRETRNAFYAGAISMFTVVNLIAELPEESACEVLAKLNNECDAFVKDVMAMAQLKAINDNA